MEVLQINQEQKHRIETLLKEKTTFAREYKLEFNRMSVSYSDAIIIVHYFIL